MKNNKLVFLLIGLIYCLEFGFRISPNVFASAWMNDLDLSYREVGQLSAYFYYAYALFQIPSGFLVDQIGFKKTFFSFSSIFVLGLFFMASAETFAAAKNARILMGVGSSVTFSSLVNLASKLFVGNLSTGVGICGFFGVMGGFLAQAPLYYLLKAIGWQKVHLFAGYFCLILLTIAFLIYPIKHHTQPDAKQHLQALKLLKTSLFWRYLITGIALVAPILSFPEMWGQLFLEVCYGYQKTKASLLMSLFFVGMSAGDLFLGRLTKKFKPSDLFNYAIIIQIICSSLILTKITQDYPMILSLMILGIGSSASALLLCFVKLYECSESALVISLFNVLFTFCSSLLHPIIGSIVDYFIQTGAPLDLAITYGLTVTVLLGLSGVSAINYFPWLRLKK